MNGDRMFLNYFIGMLIPRAIKIILFLSALLSSLCPGQSLQTKRQVFVNDSLAKYAENLAFLGMIRESEQILTKIKIEFGNSPEEQLINGKLALAKCDLMNARHLFENLLKFDKNDIELNYYLGIIYRDLAVKKPYQVVKDKTIKKSRECFNCVINRDSAYKDVLFQYSLLLQYIGKSGEAIEAMIAQINIKPGMIEPLIALRNIVDEKIVDKKSEDKIDDVFEKFKDINYEDYKKYISGEFFRIKGSIKESEILFLDLLNSNTKIPKSMLYNSLLKLYAISGDTKKTENTFWEAVNNINSNLDADILFYELKYITKPEEIQSFKKSGFYEKKNEYFPKFWARHNPNPGMKNNPRIYEHYKRLAEAEVNYSHYRDRYYYNKSKLDEFTDQGLIYLRFGKPDKIIMSSSSSIFSKDGTPHQSALDPAILFYTQDPMIAASNKHANLIESWYYENSLEFSYQEFNFWGKNKSFLTYISDIDAIEARSMMDPLYEKILSEGKYKDARGRYALRTTPYMNEKVEKNIWTVRSGLRQEHSDMEKEIITFEIPTAIYTFRSADERTVVELAYLLNKSYVFKKIPDSISGLRSECNLAIYDKERKEILFNSDTITIERPGKSGDSEFRFHHFEIEPDSLEIILAFHPLESSFYGSSRIKINIPDYSSKNLMISDIQTGIEKQNGNEIFRKNGKVLLPKANSAHNLKIPLSVYYEIYNLKKNSDGKTMYKMEYSLKYSGNENIFNELLSSGKRSNSISMEYYQTGKEETAKEFVNFEMNKLIPGKYLLEIKITDISRSKSIMKHRVIDLYEN